MQSFLKNDQEIYISKLYQRVKHPTCIRKNDSSFFFKFGNTGEEPALHSHCRNLLIAPVS